MENGVRYLFKNESQTNTEPDALRYSINKWKPYESENWVNKIIDKFDLKPTLRSLWRPKKGT